ncbi:hypothetical protein CFIMG_007625RA00001 [Ceratocystis fimbriata CBS 114723]|uniref:Uncharacterized protein n=1 Tax=Ceratocystis fimbriata CBS 114723 TaxID=1035309 RepID=A0A2C5XEM0_9PEZI|nr:hypothetical protein CFIMG_007625RA00001 [Ceratocystis fimbriata CBS 114723]
MASPEVNGLEASENAVASPPLDTDLLDTAEQSVSVESHHDLMTFASANPEATAHGTSSGTTTHSPLDTRLPKNTQYYMPPGVQRLASKLSERRINIYGTPRSATTPLSPSAAPNARSSGSGEESSSQMEAGDYDPISSDRELLIRCYAKARLPAWLRDFLPQISQYIARKMVDSAFPISKEKRRLEENKQLNPCGAIHRLPHLLKDVEDGYSSFYDFITRTSEKHGMPIDLVYSIACARKPYGDESMKVLLELSDAITSQVELAFKPWEGKAHSNTVELANGFEFKNFCEMAYNIWKHVIDEDSKFTSFPPAPGICGLPVTDFFKPIVSHFNHEETHCKVPITTLHHLIAELFEDALQAFKSVIDVGDSNAVFTELGLLADVVFCGRGATSSPATVSRHSALFGIFRKIAFMVHGDCSFRIAALGRKTPMSNRSLMKRI